VKRSEETLERERELEGELERPRRWRMRWDADFKGVEGVEEETCI
jgi:hypothetical protein